MSTLINSLQWRYATKIFDPSRKVADKDLETILEAARLSASSYGLQPYHILVVKDTETRQKLRKASWGQSQITDASHLLVLASMKMPDDKLVDDYLANVSSTRHIRMEDLEDYAAMMKSKINGLSPSEASEWTARQAYIALGNLLAAAAELKIDSCPMEGFEPEAYNQILGLNNQGLTASVVAAIGYRSPSDKTQFKKKVRRSREDLYTVI